MKLCRACGGEGGKWYTVRCACDGWCHNRARCRAGSYENCRKCRRKGIVGKITVVCPTCGAQPNRKCDSKIDGDDMTSHVHILRLRKAVEVAKHDNQIELKEKRIVDLKQQIEWVEKDLERLRRQRRNMRC